MLREDHPRARDRRLRSGRERQLGAWDALLVGRRARGARAARGHGTWSGGTTRSAGGHAARGGTDGAAGVRDCCCRKQAGGADGRLAGASTLWHQASSSDLPPTTASSNGHLTRGREGWACSHSSKTSVWGRRSVGNGQRGMGWNREGAVRTKYKKRKKQHGSKRQKRKLRP